jgi:hypothetical protein
MGLGSAEKMRIPPHLSLSIILRTLHLVMLFVKARAPIPREMTPC